MRVEVSAEQIRSAFEAVKDHPVFAESAALFERGRPPAEMIQAIALRPEFLRSFLAMSDAVYPGGIVERDVKELIILAASMMNACQFCTNSHIAIAKSLGISADPIALLENSEEQSVRQRLAVEYTRAALTDANRVPNEMFDRLREHYTDSEIVELTLMIGYINMLNLFNNCLQVTYRNEYDAG